ncbi:caspase Dronc-like [Ctenocephalides felis]|uniref:caspase Dronc-like n=1 Tax=Ctenocephalides felis TaxID=7515 RepID=UPI000E6E2B50|nr:caspase Dronc-like [Ctenocephalides felis]
MNIADRNKITQHLVELIELTKLDILLPRLLQKRIFTESMIDRFKNKLVTERDRKRDLYLAVQKRGPTAFSSLIEALEETAHFNLARLLTSSDHDNNQNSSYILNNQQNNYERSLSQTSNSPTEVTQHIHPYVLPPTSNNEAIKASAIENQAQVDMSVNPILIKVKKATQFYDMMDTEETKYPMRSKKRGVYLIINNIEFVNDCEQKRLGAEIDHRNLLELFKQMDFIGEDYMNLNMHDIQTVITKFSSNTELLHKTDCCIVVVMSHGNDFKRDGYIFSYDHNPVYLSWITDCFNNRQCPLLRNIPKIFIFQCCRGDISDNSLNDAPTSKLAKSMVDGGSTMRAMPTCSDMLICHSTIPGFQSYREAETGTWYINTICNIWAENACDTDVESMMKQVAVKFRNFLTSDNKIQTPYYENISFNTCYFHPGLYIDV